MLYFVKRNDKLEEFASYFKRLEQACKLLDRLNPDLEKVNNLFKYLPENEQYSLGDYLTKFQNFDQWADLLQTQNSSPEIGQILKKTLEKIQTVISGLKNYESFQGRIKFSQFEKLFNFENYIYDDKQFKYSIISNYNATIIPELISAAFALMVYENDVDEKVRRNMEQYFIAIMSNMDYQNFAHITQVKREFSSSVKDETNLFYILGTAPLIFDEDEYIDLLVERIATANKFIERLVGFPKEKSRIWKHAVDQEYLVKMKLNKDSFFWSKDEENQTLTGRSEDIDTNFTVENLDFIYEDVMKLKAEKGFEKYNLFIFTSTFQIIETALALEKHFYNNGDIMPSNITFVGDEKFFDLAHNKNIPAAENENQFNVSNPLYHQKKLKSFIYDLFKHSLDKNEVK